eukprot:6955419-Pyramimonas_sp.AAC.1
MRWKDVGGMALLRFAVRLSHKQRRVGRKFPPEHFLGVGPWKEKCSEPLRFQALLRRGSRSPGAIGPREEVPGPSRGARASPGPGCMEGHCRRRAA